MVTAFLQGVGATGVDLVAESLIQWAEEQMSARRDDYDTYRNYYRGEQNVKLTDRLKRVLERQGLQFVDNFMDVVVDALAERLTVIGFDGPNAELNAWLWEIWQANRMDGVQITTHTETIMMGDGYLLIDYDEETERPRITPQKPEMIIPHYNEATRRVDWLSKKWIQAEVGERPVTRMNLYFPDRIEKYQAVQGRWQPYQDEADLFWPLPWIDRSGDPLGIPVVHFRNKLLSDNFGDSEIADVIPMQDLINKTLVDLVMMLDGLAFGQRWTLNIDHGSSYLEINPGSVAEFHGEPNIDAAIGEWEPKHPQGILDSLEAIIQHIAITSRTPSTMFRMVGDFPSAEALKTAESTLVKKAQRRMVNFGNSWEDVMMMAIKLEDTFGSQRFADSGKIETIWDDAETRNELGHMGVLTQKANLGIPRAQIWREMGYTEAQIEQMQEEVEREMARSNSIGAAILRQFESDANNAVGDLDLPAGLPNPSPGS